jgi:hypothetical protein
VQAVFPLPLWNVLDGERVTSHGMRLFDREFFVPFLTHELDDGTPMLIWGFTLSQVVGVAHVVLGPCKMYRSVGHFVLEKTAK